MQGLCGCWRPGGSQESQPLPVGGSWSRALFLSEPPRPRLSRLCLPFIVYYSGVKLFTNSFYQSIQRLKDGFCF